MASKCRNFESKFDELASNLKKPVSDEKNLLVTRNDVLEGFSRTAEFGGILASFGIGDKKL